MQTQQTDRIDTRTLLAMAAGRCVDVLLAAGMPKAALDRPGVGRPCPRCQQGTDRYSPMPDVAHRGAVHCRVCFTTGSTPAPGDLLATLRWWGDLTPAQAAQWLQQYLQGQGVATAVHTATTPQPPPGHYRPPPDVQRMQAAVDAGYRRMRQPGLQRRAAAVLGVSVQAIDRLRTGWLDNYGAMCWGMCDSSLRCVGVRLRCPHTGRKWSIKGSHAGLFVPDAALTHATLDGRLWVAEGPTSTLALLTLGLPAIGLPSAGGKSSQLVAELVQRQGIPQVVAVADQDTAGAAAAAALADAVGSAATVSMVAPPAGIADARAWLQAGLTTQTLYAALGSRQ